tara:strand:- start:65 stop:838 length:774 start_codon:yes stop_codon:yes gene_type:complete
MKIIKIPVLDVGISQIKINQVPDYINYSFKNNNFGYVTVTGAHGLIESYKSKKVKIAHQKSLLSVPDGMPLVWVSKMKGSKNISRCFGPFMMDLILKNNELSQKKHFLYGGNDGVAQELKRHIEEKYNANVVGTYTPPFRPLNKKELNDLIDQINNSEADIVWVGLSTPKQDLFMHDTFDKINVKFMFGVGAAFDYFTGSIEYAPKIVQNLGLEWAYRLFLEPRRLYKRYFEIVPKFILLNLKELLYYMGKLMFRRN